MKKLSAFYLAAGLVAASALPLLAQQSASIEIPGYLNPKTGTFRPKAATTPTPDTAPKLTTYTGTLEFNYTITLETAVPSGDVVHCEATAELVDVPTSGSNENVITEEASVNATVKGSTATCTVKIPYSWPLANAAVDSVSRTYAVVITPPSIVNETDAQAVRRSTQYLPPIAVPKSGTTTTDTIDATI